MSKRHIIPLLLLGIFISLRPSLVFAQQGVRYPCTIDFSSNPTWVAPIKTQMTNRGISLTDPNNKMVLARITNNSVNLFIARGTQTLNLLHKDNLNRTLVEFPSVPLAQPILQISLSATGNYISTGEHSGGTTIFEIIEVCGITSTSTIVLSPPFQGTSFDSNFPVTTTTPTISPMTHGSNDPPPPVPTVTPRDIQLISLMLTFIITFVFVKSFVFRTGGN